MFKRIWLYASAKNLPVVCDVYLRLAVQNIGYGTFESNSFYWLIQQMRGLNLYWPKNGWYWSSGSASIGWPKFMLRSILAIFKFFQCYGPTQQLGIMRNCQKCQFCQYAHGYVFILVAMTLMLKMFLLCLSLHQFKLRCWWSSCSLGYEKLKIIY